MPEPTSRDDVAAEIVTAALDAADSSQAYARVLDRLRTVLGANAALFARENGAGTPVIVAAVPAPDAAALDSTGLARALDASAATVVRQGARDAVLALALRSPEGGRWCVALTRARTPWKPGDRERLVALRPYLDLAVDHAALRAGAVAAREREVAAAAEHERFLNVISHELRNPLAPILMWTSTLRRLRPDDPEVKRASEAIANAVNMERRLIEALLDLSRLERGVIELANETIDLRHVVRGAIDDRAGAATEARVAVEANLPSRAVEVRGDRVRLGQIVGALVENALKFTPADGRVHVGLARRGGRAEVTVTDSGPGIPADVLARLFTSFVQGKNARGGLGLGLTIAHRLLELHGGTLEASNPADGGARFVVTLGLAGA